MISSESHVLVLIGSIVVVLSILYNLLIEWRFEWFLLELALLASIIFVYGQSRLFHDKCTEGLSNPVSTTKPPMVSQPTPPTVSITTKPVQTTYTPGGGGDTQTCGFDIVPNKYVKTAYHAIGAYDLSNAYTSVQSEIKRREDYINRMEDGKGHEAKTFHQGIIDQLQVVSADLISGKPVPSEDMNILCNLKFATAE